MRIKSLSRIVAVAVVVGAVAGAGCAQEPPQQFRDPAPPKVHEIEKRDSPQAQSYDGLRFVKAAKPLPKDAKTEEWTGFLGPRRDSHSRETKLLREWPAGGPQLVWEMRRGEGYASPVISDGRVVFTHRQGGKVHIDCLAAETGKRFWRVSYPTDYRGIYIKNNGTRSTPVISGGRVYVHGIQNSLHCIDLTTGQVVWQRDLKKEFGAVDDFFGVVSSPIVVGDLLIQNVGAPKGPCVAAFDKNTGRVVWGAGDKWGASCCSPVAGVVHGRERVFVLAGGESRPPTGGLLVLDPKTGAMDFETEFRSRLYESATGSSPVVGENWVFLSSAYGVGSAVLDLAKDGGHQQRWKNRSIGLQFSTAVFEGGYIYSIDGKSDRAGAIVCLDPKTGKEVSRTDLSWDEMVELSGAKRKVSFSIGEGSLLHVDGDFLCLGDNGHLLKLKVTPKGTKVVLRAWLFGANESWAPLALNRGLLFVCQNNRERFGSNPARLLCYDLRGAD